MSQWRWFGAALLLALASVLSACSSGARLVDHAFSFDLFSDSPGVELLAYRYGDSNLPVSWMPGLNEESRAPQQTNVYGPMRQGKSLYVKWRVKTTGEIYEENVDLRHRLPDDITNHRIYFSIKGPQLFVYLIPPKKQPDGSNTPRSYPGADAETIYPDFVTRM